MYNAQVRLEKKASTKNKKQRRYGFEKGKNVEDRENSICGKRTRMHDIDPLRAGAVQKNSFTKSPYRNDDDALHTRTRRNAHSDNQPRDTR